MRLKEIMKRVAVATMSLAVAFSTVAYVPTAASVVKAGNEALNQDNSTVDLDTPSYKIATYAGSGNVQSGDFYIVIADRSRASEIDTATYSAFDALTNVYYRKVVYPGDSGVIRLSDTTIKQSGEYGIYFFNDNTSGQVFKYWFSVTDSRTNGSTTVNGPQISTRNFKRYGYGINITFRVSNETCDYEWAIYDRVPSNSGKTELASGSGSTSSKNEDIFVTTNNLEKNKQYYLWFKAYGDNTRRYTYYSDNGTSSSSNSYYTFKTQNSDTWAPDSASANANTKKNSDGTTTKTTTTTQNGVKSKTEETTGYTDGHTYTVVTATPTSSSETWKSSESKYTKYADGSAVQYMTTLMKDGTKELKEAKTSSTGVTNMVTGTYSSTGTITGLKTEILNSSNTEVLEINYNISSTNLAVKKITGTKAAVSVPDTVTINGTEYTVTSVAANAYKNNTKVKKLTLPDSVTKVGANAFKGNKNLKAIIIRNPLSSVGTNAFKGCYSTATIKIDAGASAYKKTVNKIKKAGVGSKVKFKRI